MEHAGKHRKDGVKSQLKRDHKNAEKELKVLVFGPAGSGKSTFVNNVELARRGGYSREERESYKAMILSRVIHSMRDVLKAMPKLGLQLQPQNYARWAVVMLLPSEIVAESIPHDMIDLLFQLWQDAGVRETVRRGNEFQLNVSTTYYFNSLERMRSPTYLPTDQDIFNLCVKTAGITETTIRVGNLTCRLIDVGSQQSTSEKWIHHFENVTALVFLAPLNGYDEIFDKRKGITCMQETLRLFDTVCNSRWLVNTPIILFLNAYELDLFAEKLCHSPMVDYFPDYTGGSDYDAACDYLLGRFYSLIQDQGGTSKTIYSHFTHAADTQQAGFFFSAMEAIRTLGLIRDSFR